MADIYVEAEILISRNGRCLLHSRNMRTLLIRIMCWSCGVGRSQPGLRAEPQHLDMRPGAGSYFFTWKDFDLMISQALGDASRLGIHKCQ